LYISTHVVRLHEWGTRALLADSEEAKAKRGPRQERRVYAELTTSSLLAEDLRLFVEVDAEGEALDEHAEDVLEG
jgi:hypothetical protein